ncbi:MULTISPECIES: hydroxyisourate hydrolase [Aeromicrobium]|jgi:5-hydroxyisourate hydrolase|uniref:5-hydroxyisourate hydrolase n=1 Tax=Aeromicrobium erythreum TaxID=2041 RepID=A0A0U4AS54_9ACTN|nr:MULTISPECIES: hydroxyisourate hydrolase [Aeromicrobium]ALX03296.1 5-hydroxyisourate hydrolase [Aeromicrobium erythreum]
MTTLSTHVLDAALGRPAAGLVVSLDDSVTATTDADGRIRFDDPVDLGVHELVFATGPWFADQDRSTFYPVVRVAFEAGTGQEHHHVALLLSPFAYTTYRGS